MRRKVRKEKIIGDSAQTRDRIDRYCAGQVRCPGQPRQQTEGYGQCARDGQFRIALAERRFRSKDQATDVLSFPPAAGFVNGLAGDIAISADIARQNARRLGHSAADEIKILALHAVLHLVGYDHEHDDGAMASKEAALRRSLKLPLGLIERNVGTGRTTARPKSKAAGGGARAARAVRTR